MSASTVVRGVDSRTSGGAAATGVFVTHDVSAIAGMTSGDIMVVQMQFREPPTTLSTFRVPAGWTAQTALSASGGSGSYAVYTAKYGVDVTGTSWTWDNGAGNTTVTRWVSNLIVIKNTAASGVAGHVSAAISAATTTPSSGNLTTTGQTILVGGVGCRLTGGNTWTPPAGWIEESDVSESTGTNAAALEVSVDDTTPVAAGTYAYSPTAATSMSAGFAAITALTYSSSSSTVTETFTGTNGAAWGSNWTQTSAGATGSSATIQNNAGQLAIPTVGGYATGSIEQLSAMSNQQDAELLVTIKFSVIQEEYLYFTLRDTGDNTTGYVINVFPHVPGVQFSKLTSTGIVTLGSSFHTEAWTAGTTKKLRFRVQGNALAFKLWDAGTTEPSGWDGIISDSSYPTAQGKMRTYVTSGNTTNGGNVTLDDLTVQAPSGSAAYLNDLQVGALDVSNLYVGSSGVVRAFVGSTQVFP